MFSHFEKEFSQLAKFGHRTEPCSLPIYNFNFSLLFLTFYLLYYDTESPVFLPTHHSVLGHVGTDF